MPPDPPTVDMSRGVYRRLYSGALTGRRVNAASEFSELLLWRIHMVCDDFGRFKADPEILAVQAFPLRRAVTARKVRKGRDELDRLRLIDLYVIDGETYGSIVGFEDMQPAGRNGRRIARNPPPHNPSVSRDLEKVGILGNPGAPGKSKPSDDHSDDHYHSDDHPEDLRDGDAGPSPTHGGRREKWTDEQIRAIYLAHPKPGKPKEAAKAARRALRDLPKDLKAQGQSPPEDDYGWLLKRTKLWASSPLVRGKLARGEKKYLKAPAAWLNAGGHLEDPETWKEDEGGRQQSTGAHRRRADEEARGYGERPSL